MKRFSTLWHEFRPRTFEIQNYGWRDLRHDALAGVTVGLVAIPLALAFAIASGVPPARGLITAIVAGFLISALGGSRVQIGGPTGAFIVVLYGVVVKFGYQGLVLATLMAGVMLIVAGLLRLGKYIRLVPGPVVMGFTAGIAFIIFSGQVKDFLGLPLTKLPADTLHQWIIYGQNVTHFGVGTLGVGLMGFGALMVLRQLPLPFPPAILAVAFCTALVWVLGLDVTTIGSKFGGIPQELPRFVGMDFFHGVTLGTLKTLLPSAFSIAFLAGIESLLSALVADKMSHDHHKPNTELVAQGVANIASVLLGGIAATGAIARTGVNAKAGARTPVSGMVHGLFLLGVMLTLAPLASAVPLTALAVVLFFTSWDMSERKHLPELMQGPRLHLLMFTGTFLGTVLIDLTSGVLTGMMIAFVGHFHGRITTKNLPI